MNLLTSNDYDCLNKMGLQSIEVPDQHFLILKDYELPEGIYNVNKCNILVIIPNNYPDAGNDMFWVHPELYRSDGKQIPAAFKFGGNDARHHDNKEYCRWSRHWDNNQRWNPSEDGISTIINRLTWCLNNPDCK